MTRRPPGTRSAVRPDPFGGASPGEPQIGDSTRTEVRPAQKCGSCEVRSQADEAESDAAALTTHAGSNVATTSPPVPERTGTGSPRRPECGSRNTTPAAA